MLRYLFFILPLISALFVWFCYYFQWNTDFFVPTILVIIGTIGWLKFKVLTKFQRLLVMYITLTYANEAAAYYFGIYYQMNGPVYNIYNPLQLITYALIYSELLKPKRYKKYYWSIILIVLIINLLNSFYFGTIEKFPALNNTLIIMILLPLTLFQFRKMILFPVTEQLEKQPEFWFNYGTFIFVSLNFFNFAFLGNMPDLPDWVYAIIWGSNIFLYATYFLAIYLSTKPKSSES